MTFLADTWPFPLLSFRHGGSGVAEINDWAPTGFWSLMRVPNRSRPRVITVCVVMVICGGLCSEVVPTIINLGFGESLKEHRWWW